MVKRQQSRLEALDRSFYRKDNNVYKSPLVEKTKGDFF